MSYENPTPLRVGATGTLDGRGLRVAGRVVVGMQDEDGETYYWNEFNLVDGFGRNVTLVFEETEDGAEWKVFKYFEPLRAMTAGEAAAKRVGDTVHLDGTPTRITLVDQSRVYHIEGVAPDGVELGDTANYFNADQGKRMLVASWTGDEIEFFEGHDISAEHVTQAFGLPASTAGLAQSRRNTFSNSTAASHGRPSGSRIAQLFVGVAFLLVTLISFYSYAVRGRPATTRATSAPPPVKLVAPPVRLATGTKGTVGPRSYTLASHAVMEIARVGRRFDRHEYLLTTDTNEDTLLINGLNGGAKEWHLLTAVTANASLAGMNPYEAATRRKGSPVPAGGRTLRITELFQSKAISSDGSRAAQNWPALQYGFLARDTDDWLVARWTESSMQVHRGRALSEAEVLAAFAVGPEKAR